MMMLFWCTNTMAKGCQNKSLKSDKDFARPGCIATLFNIQNYFYTLGNKILAVHNSMQMYAVSKLKAVVSQTPLIEQSHLYFSASISCIQNNFRSSNHITLIHVHTRTIIIIAMAICSTCKSIIIKKPYILSWVHKKIKNLFISVYVIPTLNQNIAVIKAYYNFPRNSLKLSQIEQFMCCFTMIHASKLLLVY